MAGDSPNPSFLMQSAPGARTIVNGREYFYFAGTSYLGLHGHPKVIEAACEAMRRYGIHSATSRSGFGNNPPTLDVESRFADYMNAQASFYFASGYVGMSILCGALSHAHDVAFVDDASHYAVMDALKQTNWPVIPFRHGDPADLRSKLRANVRAGQRPIVLSDGVFPVLGSIAPARLYAEILADYPGSALALDDAHGVGVLGEHGWGTFEQHGFPATEVNVATESARGPTAFYSCATLSKALGGYGGVIAGSAEFVGRLKAGSFYYSGASQPPVPAAAASASAIELVAESNGRLQRELRTNITRLRTHLSRLGLEQEAVLTPIIPLCLGDASNMKHIQQSLMDRGFIIAYSPSYSGVGPEGVLRIAVFATHSVEMIDQLADELSGLI